MGGVRWRRQTQAQSEDGGSTPNFDPTTTVGWMKGLTMRMISSGEWTEIADVVMCDEQLISMMMMVMQQSASGCQARSCHNVVPTHLDACACACVLVGGDGWVQVK